MDQLHEEDQLDGEDQLDEEGQLDGEDQLDGVDRVLGEKSAYRRTNPMEVEVVDGNVRSKVADGTIGSGVYDL